MSDWIDVKQELPQHGEMVIGSRNGRAFIYRYNSAANPEFPFRDEFGSGDGPSVTHWMPLPSPPASATHTAISGSEKWGKVCW